MIPDQGLHVIDYGGNRMRFERDDDIVLLTEFSGILCCSDRYLMLVPLLKEFEPILLHRLKMGTTRHKAHVCPSLSQLDPHISANRTRAKDTNFHALTRRFHKAQLFSHANALHFSCRPFGNFIKDHD